MNIPGKRTGVTMRPNRRRKYSSYTGQVGILSAFRRLRPSRSFIIVSAIAIILTGVVYFVKIAPGTFIPLGDICFSSQDLKDASVILTELGIEYRISAARGIIEVPRKLHARAFSALADMPNRMILKYPLAEGMLPPRLCGLKQIEMDMKKCIGEIGAVGESYVKILPGSRTSGSHPRRETSAAVMLSLKPGSRISINELNGITHLLACHVAGLKHENVVFVDTKGTLIYNRRIWEQEIEQGRIGEQESRQGIYTDELWLRKEIFDDAISKKAQQVLDDAAGKGKCRVFVSSLLHFSREFERWEASQRSGFPVLNEPSRVSFPPFSVERISCILVVQNLTRDQTECLAVMIGNSIGCDPHRGDSITVVESPVYAALCEDMQDTPVGSGEQNRALWYPVGAASLCAVTVCCRRFCRKRTKYDKYRRLR